MSDQRTLLRKRGHHDSGKVSFVELFFDLVFVFAITQLSHTLIAHFSPLGALQTALLLLAVWWVWIFTSWVTNWLDPQRIPVRLCLLALMLAGLILSSSLPEAFESRGAAFAGAYVFMQVGRTLFFLWAVRGHPNMARSFQRILVWLLLSAAFWIGGAFAEGNGRLALWAVAIGLEFVSPSLYFWVPGLGRSTLADWDVEGGHLAERCGLFIIIALGESILVTGATFAELTWTLPVVVAFVASFVGSLAMWWLYFDTAAERGSEHIARARDPGRLARLAYTYLHLPIVGGIIVLAVADEFVLAHPTGHADGRTVIAVLGGTALYLLGNLLFKWAIAGRPPLSHLVGILAMGALAFAAPLLAPIWLMIASTATLVAIAAWEHYASPCVEAMTL